MTSYIYTVNGDTNFQLSLFLITGNTIFQSRFGTRFFLLGWEGGEGGEGAGTV